MGSRQIVLVYTAGISVLDAGIFWREAKTERLFSQCTSYLQQHKLVLTCVAWGADRKDAVLHKVLIIFKSLQRNHTDVYRIFKVLRSPRIDSRNQFRQAV